MYGPGQIRGEGVQTEETSWQERLRLYSGTTKLKISIITTIFIRISANHELELISNKHPSYRQKKLISAQPQISAPTPSHSNSNKCPPLLHPSNIEQVQEPCFVTFLHLRVLL